MPKNIKPNVSIAFCRTNEHVPKLLTFLRDLFLYARVTYFLK